MSLIFYREHTISRRAPRSLGLIVGALVLLASCNAATTSSSERGAASSGRSQPSAAEQLATVVADPRRDEDRARDVFRHPQETLTFFGLEPDMVVADVLPGGGWYTRLLLPYVGEEGGYVGINYGVTTAERQYGDRFDEARRTRHMAFPLRFMEEARADGPQGANVIGAYLFDAVPSELDGALDMVLFARAMHHLNRTSTIHGTLERTFELLKPGGVVGVVQHRTSPDATDEYAVGNKGYMRQADVVAVFEAAGFIFEEASEINANPNDPANWPNGVWTLPPRLALGLLNRDEYEAIGESDRMTLRFRKPEA